MLVVGGKIFAVFLEGALDSNTVDIEEIGHHRRVFFGVTFAVGLNGPIVNAAIVFFPLGGQFALVGKRPLQQLVGIGQGRVGSRFGGLRGAGRPPGEENRGGE